MEEMSMNKTHRNSAVVTVLVEDSNNAFCTDKVPYMENPEQNLCGAQAHWNGESCLSKGAQNVLSSIAHTQNQFEVLCVLQLPVQPGEHAGCWDGLCWKVWCETERLQMESQVARSKSRVKEAFSPLLKKIKCFSAAMEKERGSD